MPTNSEWNGTPEFRDAICFLMYVQLWKSLPVPRFLASHPALHSEFRDALTFPYTFLEFEPVFEYSIKGRFRNPLQQSGSNAIDRKGGIS